MKGIRDRMQEVVEIVVVGNKGDLEEGKRGVGREEGREWARKWGVEWREVSAKEGTGV